MYQPNLPPTLDTKDHHILNVYHMKCNVYITLQSHLTAHSNGKSTETLKRYSRKKVVKSKIYSISD